MSEIKLTNTSNTLWNDSQKPIAFAEQIKQQLINWAEYTHVTEELGQNRPDTQNLLNNLFLSVYEKFLTFLNDADATSSAINTWKEIERFLADYTDTGTLKEIVDQLNSNIESRLSVVLENSTGSSTTNGMSQKAITDALDAKQDTIADLGAIRSGVAKVGYYECDSLGNSADKAISVDNYALSTGGSMKVKMTNANTADNATLNINSTGAKPLFYDGERASANNSWEAGETVEIYYDGTSYYANNVAGGSGSGDGAFDVSTKYPTSGVEGGNTYTLEGALAVLNANLSASKKKGGMSIKFIQSSDNNYIQARLMANSFTTDVTKWQTVDAEPTAGSNNLVKSGGVAGQISQLQQDVFGEKSGSRSSDSGSWFVINFVQGHKYRIKNTTPVGGSAFSAWTATAQDLSANVDVLCSGLEPQKTGDVIIASVDATYMRIGSTTSGISFTVEDMTTLNGRIGLLEINKYVLNVNRENDHPAAYSSKVYARRNVSLNQRFSGAIITYLLDDGWHFEQFIGADYSVWNYNDYWVDKDDYYKEMIDKVANYSENNVVRLNDEIYYFDGVSLTNMVDGKYIDVYGNLNDFSAFKVAYIPYTVGTHYRLHYPNSWPQEAAPISFAIYSVVDVENVNSSNAVKLGGYVRNMEAGVDVDIISYDESSKLLCIQYSPTNIPIVTIISDESVKDRLEELDSAISLRYSINNDDLLLSSPYGDVDLLINLKRFGGNNLFDFKEIATIPHGSENIATAARTVIQNATTDWHIAFLVAAKNNADGDNKTGEVYNKYFTGGNHQYNNEASGSTPTARQVSLKFYADGKLVTSGNGYARRFEMRWVNRVQAYNTTKADGSGREILEERHSMFFDGQKFEDTVELIPLENISMEKWYGFATAIDSYNNTRFVGGENRAVITGNGSSGNANPNGVIAQGNSGEIEMFVNPTYDIGDRAKMYSAGALTEGAFRYGTKVYMWIIYNRDMDANTHYFLNGGWIFRPLI